MNLSDAIRTASAQHPGRLIGETLLAHYVAVALTGRANVRTTTIITTIVGDDETTAH